MELETHAGLQAQTTPPPVSRPARLSEGARPQAAVTVGYVAVEAPSLVVAPVAAQYALTRPRSNSSSNSLSWLARRRRRRRTKWL